MTYDQRLRQLNSKRSRDTIKAAIADMGYTQLEAGEMLGIPLSTLGKWLNNRQSMCDRNVFEVAKLCGQEVSVD